MRNCNHRRSFQNLTHVFRRPECPVIIVPYNIYPNPVFALIYIFFFLFLFYLFIEMFINKLIITYDIIIENLQGNFLFLQIKDVLERGLRLCSINVTFLSFEEFSSAVQVRNIFQNITGKCFYCMSFLGWFNKFPLVA